MTRIICLIAFTIITTVGLGQKYLVTYTSGAYVFDGYTNGHVLSFALLDNQGIYYMDDPSGSFIMNKPTREISREYDWYYDGNGTYDTNVKDENEPLTLQDCDNFTGPYNYGGNTFSSTFSFSIKPYISIASSPSSQTFCLDQTINLTGTSGWSSYRWYYRLATGGWQLLKTTTTENVSVSIQDIFGSGYTASDLNQTFYLTYNVGTGCDVNSSNAGQVGPYSFSNTPLSATTISKQEIKCKGSNDGSVTVASFNRSLLSGETVQSVSLYSQQTALPAYFVKSSSGSTVSGISPGTYYLLVESNVVPCNTPATLYGPVTFTDPTIVTFTSTSSQPSCGGGSNGLITATPSGGSGTGYQYSKDNGVSYQAGNVLSGLTAGTYAVVVKDGNGCVATKQDVVVTQPTAISISALLPSDVSCFGGTNGKITVTASGGTNTLTYSKDGSSFQSSNIITGLVAGAYTITVKDANNCTNTSSPVTVSSPSLMSTTITTTDALCNGSSNGVITVGTVSGGSGGFTYSLNGTAFQSSNVFTSVSAATYTITIKDVNNCTITKSTTVNQPAAISVNTSSTIITCNGGSDGQITVTAANGMGTYSYSKNGTTFQSANVFTGLSASTYTITVIDQNGCTKTANQTVTANPVIGGTFSITTPVRCQGELNGALDLTPSGGVSPYTYNWSNGATIQDISNIGAGNYSVTITDSKACQKTVNFALTEPLQLSPTAILSDYNGVNVSCSNSTNGSIDLTVTGGTAPYDYAWSNAATSQDISGLAGGNYNVTVTDSHGCTALKNFTLQAPTQPVLSITQANDINCFGGSDGTFKVDGAGGITPYSFSLNSTTVWQTSKDFLNLSTGSYTLRLKDANGCQVSTTKSLASPSALSISISNLQNTTCGQMNGSATATVNGGTTPYTYTWFSSANTSVASTFVASNLGADVYRVDVTDQHECLIQKNVTISSSNGPLINVTAVTGTTCSYSQDGSATISISDGQSPYSILWPSGQTATTGVNLPAGDEIITVNDAGGCKVFKTITIPSPPKISIATISKVDPTCYDKQDGSITVLASGGNGGFTYLWNSGETTPQQTLLKAGDYSVTATDVKGCKDGTSFTLVNPTKFVVDLGADRQMCEGQNISLSSSVAGSTYSWTSNTGFVSTDAQVIVSKPGTYKLKETDVNGCEEIDSITLVINPNLLKTDFLMISEAHAGDSIVVIDISWPLPENSTWDFDDQTEVIYKTNDLAVIRFATEGIYTVGIDAQLATCNGHHEQQITILKAESTSGRQSTESLISSVLVYPNPNDGKFSIEINLQESHNVSINIVSMSGTQSVYKEELTGESRYHRDYDLRHLTSGVYFIFIKAGDETRMIRVVLL